MRRQTLSLLACVTLSALALLRPAPAEAQAASTTTDLRGVVVDSAGQPVRGAEIDVVGTGLLATADDSGAFRVPALPANARALRVRRLGYAPQVVNLPMQLGARHDVRIRLRGAAAVLEAVTVEGRYGKPARYANTTRFDEFYRRRSLGTGRFLTREEIERMNARDALDLVRVAPGVRVDRQPLGEAILTFPRCGQAKVGTEAARQTLGRARQPGGGAFGDASGAGGMGQGRIQLFVDGLPVDLNALPEYLSMEIEAIEVYRSSIELPPEARGNGCAAILIWTRHVG